MSNELSIGVIGLGIWGANHPLVYDDYHRSNVMVVCDLDETKAKKIGTQFKCDWTTNFEEVINSDVAAVSVATPDFAHFDPVSKLLLKNKHIFVEKPLTTNLDEAKELCALAKKSSSIAMVDFHNRWNPQWGLVKSAIENGEIGQPSMGYIRLSNSIEVAESWLSWSGKSGPHWFLLTHIMDLINWLLDEIPDSIYAIGKDGLLRGKGIETWDSFQVLAKYPSTNICFETSWVVPNSIPSVIDSHFTLYGERGKIDFDFDFAGLSFATNQKLTFPFFPLGQRDRWGNLSHFMYAPLRYFVDCVLDEIPPICSFEESLINVAMVQAVLNSITIDAPVRLQGLLKN